MPTRRQWVVHGLAISKDESFEKHLNKYDVIYLDITWFISSSDNIKNTVRILQQKVIEELREGYPNAKKENTLPETLAAINKITGNRFIIIIDEWDALFREAKDDSDLQDEYILLLRGLFKNSGFTDKLIEAAYMTGILPIKKYGSQSAVSDFREYTMLSPGKLAKYMGFTETEVIELCQKNGVEFSQMKHWYDGYSFRYLKSVYNPNSVIEAIKREEFGSYWTRTETYESLKIYIDLNMDGLKEDIIQMLGGAHIKIKVGSFQNDMTTIKVKDDVLTLLVHLGYLAYDSEEEAVFIPNEEINQEFILSNSSSRYQLRCEE
ncbi:MAG: AAA family ATPase [Eubacteriales bacterium]|nr:AAA family ATPase [Eubacteriales bacterium]